MVEFLAACVVAGTPLVFATVGELITEKSGSRTAGKEPHPLCDNLRYLAGDYTKYYKD